MNLRSLLAQSPASHSAAFKLVRARARLAPAGTGPPVLVNSVPKAGTHLVSSILDHSPGYRFSGLHLRRELFDRQRIREGGVGPTIEPDMDWPRLRAQLSLAKRGQYATGHLWSAPELSRILAALDFKVLFVARDPRDIVVSTVTYVRSRRAHRHGVRFGERLGSDEARMLAVISGFPRDRDDPGLLPLADRLRAFVGWRDDPATLWCRFEDLVGERGDGDRVAQEGQLLRIFAHLGMDLDGESAIRIADAAWATKSATFRSGRVKGWESAFTPLVAQTFEEQVGAELMAELGYG